MIKGVILDFNGTLYLDHDINHKAWEYAFDSIRPVSSTEKYSEWKRGYAPYDYILSKKMYEHFGIQADDKTINQLSESKEIEYRKLAVSINKNSLINGADKLLDYFKSNNMPYFIASMAPRSNFDFYLDFLHLSKWFTYDNIIYDNGEYFDKNSQIEEAARRMNVDVKDCLIIEDTPENIKLAIEKIGAKQFIYINTRNRECIAEEILQEIKDYTEIDYKIFDN